MNAVQGTAGFSIPLPVSGTRQGAAPQLSLGYDSGSGAGCWGIGWQLQGVLDITRQTRKGLPRYLDGQEGEEDIFVLSGAEDLAPVHERDNKGNLVPQDGTTGNWKLAEKFQDGFTVRQYRPRIESLYALIERWTDALDPEDIHWRILTSSNEMLIMGRNTRSRIMSGTKIFSWLCCEWYDCLGNARVYEYKAENGEGVDLAQVNEMNRSEEARGAQQYLKRVRYGNRTPVAAEDRRSAPSTSMSPAKKLGVKDWMFSLVFDYGEYDWANPTADETEGMLWQCREDAFSSFKAGFEVRTYRLVRRVLMFHHFVEELGKEDYLVKALECKYEEGKAMTYLKSAQQAGFMLRTTSDPLPADEDKGSLYCIKRLPPLEME